MRTTPTPFWQRPVLQRAQQHIKQVGRVGAKFPELLGWEKALPKGYEAPEGLDPRVAAVLLKRGIDPSPEAYDYPDELLRLADDVFEDRYGDYREAARKNPLNAIDRKSVV